MKLAFIQENNSASHALKNLLLWEGFEFSETHPTDAKKIKDADVIISVAKNQSIIQQFPDKIYIIENMRRESGSEKVILEKNGLQLINEGNFYWFNTELFSACAQTFSFQSSQGNVSEYSRFLFESVSKIAMILGKKLETKWYYPHPAEFAAAFTLDIDHLNQYKNLFKQSLMQEVAAESIENFPFKKAIAKLFRQVNERKRYEKFPSMILFAKNAGFTTDVFVRSTHQKEEDKTGRLSYIPGKELTELEQNIGLHFGATLGKFSKGFIAPETYADPCEPWTEGISSDHQFLENSLNQKVIGSRAHHGHIWIPDSFHELEGKIEFDSSMYGKLAVHEDRNFNGKVRMIEAQTCTIPFHPIHQNKMFSFLELPVLIFEEYNREKLSKDIAYAKKWNGLAIALYHPSVDISGASKFFKLSTMEKAWKTSLTELNAWLRKRSSLSVSQVPYKRISGLVQGAEEAIKVGSFLLEKND